MLVDHPKTRTMKPVWVLPWLLEQLVGRAVVVGHPSPRRRRPMPRPWAWVPWKVLLP